MLKNYLKKWNLSDPHKIASTFTSDVYKVHKNGKSLALKILSEIGQKDEINGATTLNYFNGNGAATLFEYDEKAHLLDFINGENLVEKVVKGNDSEATEIICSVLVKLHHAKSKNFPKTLTPLMKRFSALIDRKRDNSIYDLGADIALELLQSPENEVVLHGDIHHQNILYDQNSGWLAIDPKGLIGESSFDAVNILFNPPNMSSYIISKDRIFTQANIITKLLKVDLNRFLKFAFSFGCLSSLWSVEDGFSPKETLKLTNLIKEIINL